MKVNVYYLLFAAIFLFSNCVKEKITLDENTVVPGLSPSLAVPLGEILMTLEEMEDISNSELASYNAETGLFEFILRRELFDYPASSLFGIEPQNFDSEIQLDNNTATALNIGSAGDQIDLPFLQSDFVLDFNEGEQIDSIKIINGNLELLISSEIRHDFDISITLPALKLNGQAYTTEIPLDFGSIVPFNTSVDIDLAGYTLDFTGPFAQPNVFPLNAQVTLTHTGEMSAVGEELKFVIDININEFEYVYGYFGQYTEILQVDSTNVNFFDDLNGGMLHISDPRIELFIENSAGISLEVDFVSILAPSDGGSITLGGPDLTEIPIIEAAAFPGDTTFTTHTIDNSGTSPTISDAIDTNPSLFIYNASATTNPNGIANNFIWNTSSAKCYADIIIPAFGYANNFTLTDTIKADIEDIFLGSTDSSDVVTYEDIEDFTIRLVMENGIALSAGIKAYFVDSSNVKIDSLFFQDDYEYILEPGFVDFSLDINHPDYGRVLSATTAMTDIHLTQEQIEHLIDNQSSHMIIQAIANTNMSEDQQEIKFYPEDYIGIKVSAKVDFNFDLSE